MLRKNHSSIPVAPYSQVCCLDRHGNVKHSEESAEEETNPSGEKQNYVQQHKISLYRTLKKQFQEQCNMKNTLSAAIEKRKDYYKFCSAETLTVFSYVC